MKKTQAGFANLLLIIVAIGVIGGVYYFSNYYPENEVENEIEIEENVIEDDTEDIPQPIVKNIDITTSTTSSTLAPATTTVVNKAEIKAQVAPVVVKKPFITISKSDLFERNIAKFTYLGWTYSFDDRLAFMGKSKFHEVSSPSHSVGYTLTGDDIVNYYARLVQFDSYADAKALLNKVKNDNDTYVFNKSFPLVYGIRDPNSRSVMWVHNNILIMIHANAGSPSEDLFLKTAFNTYIDIYPAN